MTPSCFDLLDVHVIGGRADVVALRAPGRDWTYAQLLEEVAAFGGALRHCGVTPGDRVVVTLPESVRAVVAILACARIGAVHDRAGGSGLVLVTAKPPEATDAKVVLVAREPGREVELQEDRDYDWDVVLRAGRTDPAGCVEGALVTPYDDEVRGWLAPLLAGGSLDLR